MSGLLAANNTIMIIWCMVASFGAYFSMYAFRKPFNAGTYDDLELSGLDYKSVLIISQVFGYMLSKFIGIKVVSELKPARRIMLLLGLIGIAECALLLFGSVPHPYNFVALFFNGLPLGMIWGIVFSFLEGRRFTEILAAGLSVSVVMSSGILKTIGRWLIESQGVDEFWMPFVVGAMFVPAFVLFVWMLAVVPAPTKDDMAMRVQRVPMTGLDRRRVFMAFWPGLSALVLCFMVLTVSRDFRDNFSVEIWNSLGFEGTPSVYSETELPIGLLCLAFLGMLVLIKNNLLSLWVVHGLVAAGALTMLISTWMFKQGELAPDTWMLVLGFGLYLAYLPFGTVMYERFIAAFRIRGNAGFLMYISDSSGYLGSVALLVLKEFISPELSWLDFFIGLSVVTALIVIAGTVASALFIRSQQPQLALSVLPEK
jgi:hypothetical protein